MWLWLFYDFFSNSNSILKISHGKTFKTRYTWCCNNSNSYEVAGERSWLCLTILAEVARLSSAWCSDRKCKKQQNLTSKQMIRIVTLFFQRIKLTSLDFYFRRFTRRNSSILEKMDTSTHPEGLQTFEHHLKTLLIWRDFK